ncbi:polymer-forming cytoskeletal protein [Algiphilus sp. NNCM1]|nr:polymer-forming cytoskeletal protein [Algiphilus acroporae]
MDTLVGRQTELLGDVNFKGGLHVDGVIKGKVSATSDKEAVLSISESGSIEGDVHVANVIINGSVHGDVHALGRLTLNSCARVVGNVHYKTVEMASGATVNGQMVHEIESKEQTGNVTSFARIESSRTEAGELGDADGTAKNASASSTV